MHEGSSHTNRGKEVRHRDSPINYYCWFSGYGAVACHFGSQCPKGPSRLGDHTKALQHFSCLVDTSALSSRLSRARRTSENAFGVLVNRWQIYRSPLRHEPKRATDIVLATVALHNFLRSKRITRQLYTPQDSLDVEDILTGVYTRSHFYIPQ